MLSRHVSNAALDEAAKRRASVGTVDADKCRRIAVEIGEDSLPSQIALLPSFQLSEINAGRVLQRGSFGTVREIRSIEAVNDDDNEPDQQLQDKKLLADSLLLEGSTDARYAIKVGAHVAKFFISSRTLNSLTVSSFVCAQQYSHSSHLTSKGLTRNRSFAA